MPAIKAIDGQWIPEAEARDLIEAWGYEEAGNRVIAGEKQIRLVIGNGKS